MRVARMRLLTWVRLARLSMNVLTASLSCCNGHHQLIALARALYGAPKFIVLDEPSANLDASGEQALRNSVMHMKAAGLTVLAIEHKAHLLQVCDHVLVMAGPGRTQLMTRDDFIKEQQGRNQNNRPSRESPQLRVKEFKPVAAPSDRPAGQEEAE